MKRMLLTTLLVIALLVPCPGSAFKRTAVGEPLKDFTLETLQGDSLNLSTAGGTKATLILFWASWNARSVEALRDVQKLYAERHEDGFAVIAVNVDSEDMDQEETARVRTIAADLGLTFPVAIDAGLAIYSDYGVVAVPAFVLANANRTIEKLVQGYATSTREELPDHILATLGIAVEGAQSETASLPPAEGKAYRYLRMGELFLARSMPGRAEEAFRKAVQEDPGYVDAYQALAEVLDVQGKIAEADEIRRKISSMAQRDR